MSTDGYDAIDIVNDAVRFTESRYGKHHIERLTKQREHYLQLAMDTQYADGFRAHAASKASVYGAEIDYLTTQNRIKADPKLLERMKEKIRGKINKTPKL